MFIQKKKQRDSLKIKYLFVVLFVFVEFEFFFTKFLYNHLFFLHNCPECFLLSTFSFLVESVFFDISCEQLGFSSPEIPKRFIIFYNTKQTSRTTLFSL